MAAQISIVQRSDLKFILSNKVATLDQASLKLVAADLAAIDAKFLTQISSLSPAALESDASSVPEVEKVYPDSDGDFLTNVLEPDASASL